MSVSIGIDIVDVERIRGSYVRWGEKFLRRILTPREYEYCRSKANFLQSVAGRVACKEAVYKAVCQHGFSGLSWQDIEILGETGKAPVVHISQRAATIGQQVSIAVSISHSDKHAVSVAYVELKQEGV